MASPSAAFLCSLLALLLWVPVGFLIAGRLPIARDLRLAVAPVLGWAVHVLLPRARLLHTKGIPLQVIYNASGNPAPRTDAAWTDSAASNFKAFESGAWPKPDAAVFNYWTQPPMRVLPENDPTTITGLVAQYIRWREAQGRPVSLK